MEYQFNYVVKRTHLHVIGSGTYSADSMRRFFADTDRVRRENQLNAVLCELRFMGPSLHLGGLYAMMVDHRAVASTVERIACVDTNAEHLPERKEFIELASEKLGVNFRFFRTVAEAERWLNS